MNFTATIIQFDDVSLIFTQYDELQFPEIDGFPNEKVMHISPVNEHVISKKRDVLSAITVVVVKVILQQ